MNMASIWASAPRKAPGLPADCYLTHTGGQYSWWFHCQIQQVFLSSVWDFWAGSGGTQCGFNTLHFSVWAPVPKVFFQNFLTIRRVWGHPFFYWSWLGFLHHILSCCGYAQSSNVSQCLLSLSIHNLNMIWEGCRSSIHLIRQLPLSLQIWYFIYIIICM